MTTMTGDAPAPPPPPPPAGPEAEAAPPPASPPAPPVRGRLTRSRDGRLVGGVCAGLGRWTDVDPVVFRVTVAVLTLFGGSGLVLYALAWLLLPEDGAPSSPAERLVAGRSGNRMVAPAAAIGAAVLVLVLLEGGGGFGNGEAFPVAVLVGLGVWIGVRNRTDGDRAAPPAWPGAPGPVYGPWGQATTATEAVPSGAPTPTPTSAYAPPGYAPPGYAATGYAPPTDPAGTPPTGTAYPAVGWYPPPPPRRRRSVLGRLTLSALLVVLGLAALLDAADVVDLTPAAGFALALVVVGTGLVVGTWYGRSRGLIVLGALLSAGLVISSSVDAPTEGGTGNRLWAPTTVGELRSPYRLGAGDAVLDLTRLPATAGTVRVEAEVGLGSLEVRVPEDVTVEVTGRVGAGELTVLDRREEGFGNDLATLDEVDGSGSRKVVLDLRVGVGELEVVRAQA